MSEERSDYQVELCKQLESNRKELNLETEREKELEERVLSEEEVRKIARTP